MFTVYQGTIQNNLIAPLSTIVSSHSCRVRGTSNQKRNELKQNDKEDDEVNLKFSSIQTLEHLGDGNVQNVCDLISPQILRNWALGKTCLIHQLSNDLNVNKLLDYYFKRVWKDHWLVSHKSGYTFTENKDGSQLFTTRSQLLLSQPSSLWNNIQHRGFKTKYSIERESTPSSVANRLKQTLHSKPLSIMKEVENNAKLKGLLSKESSSDLKNNMKIAFAEGYLAGSPQKTDFKAVGRAILTTVLIASIISVMVTSWSKVKMHLGHSNEVHPEEVSVTFEDVRGVEEAKQELQEVVEFLKNPDKFTALGAELPKGVLLVGPPGIGKTLLARAVAGEASVPFFHAAGAEFDEVLVGQGARRVRDLFRAAQVRAPSVIFIDEIDSVGAKRTNSVLHPYANQTINQLLSEMDGFHKNEGVIVLGATNRREDLDKALLRPGRFDVEIQVPSPDLAGRREILDYYLGKVKTGPDVDSSILARGTTGFTGADIKNVVNQAALRAAIDQVDVVSLKHLESARDKVLMGPEKKSRIPDKEANLITAYHEGGHTLVSYYTKDSLPVHKVTIIPRGPSLGHTAYIPAKEQYHMTRSQLTASLDSLMGGRAAEEIIFGNDLVTSGASSDLKRATSIASHMVKDLGMSDKVGLRTFDDHSDQLIGTGDSSGPATKEVIDGEIRKLLHDSYARAKKILTDHAKEHKALAEALMRYETLDADDIKAILDGRPVTKEF